MRMHVNWQYEQSKGGRRSPQMVTTEHSLWTIDKEPWTSILNHALDAYPQEACGILLCPNHRAQSITASQPLRNATSEDPTVRYVLDPKEILAVCTWAEEKDLDVCGFYHSHPDHPSAPSKHDRRYVWDGYLYLIISIHDGVFKDSRAWRWDEEQGRFEEVFAC
jgi:proteasome lid subunit RPN8/RPN11